MKLIASPRPKLNQEPIKATKKINKKIKPSKSYLLRSSIRKQRVLKEKAAQSQEEHEMFDPLSEEQTSQLQPQDEFFGSFACRLCQ